MKRLLTSENLFRKEALRHQSERFLGEPRASAFQVRSIMIVCSLLLFLALAAVALLNVPYSRTVRLNCALASSGDHAELQIRCPVARHAAAAVLSAILEARSSLGSHVTDGHLRPSEGMPLDGASQSESVELLLVADRFVEPAAAAQQTIIIDADMGRPKIFGSIFDR